MYVIQEELDSLALGRNVLQIKDIESLPQHFKTFEEEFLHEFSPRYTYVKVPAESLSLVHYFENYGFQFVEFQLQMTKQLLKKFNTAMANGFLDITYVNANDDIEPILQLSDSIMDIDRISLDPEMGRPIAKERYRLYIKKSWQNSNERVIKGYDVRDGSLVGFQTNLHISETATLNLLGGVAEKYAKTGAVVLFERLILNQWIDEGIKEVTTHISLSNYKIMESQYKGIDFKPHQAFVILRKLYS